MRDSDDGYRFRRIPGCMKAAFLWTLLSFVFLGVISYKIV